MYSLLLSHRDRFTYNSGGRSGGGGDGAGVVNSRWRRLSAGREGSNSRVIIRTRRGEKVLRMTYRLGIIADLEITDVNLVVKGVSLRKRVEKGLKVWPGIVGIIWRIEMEFCLHCEIDKEGWFFGRRGGGEEVQRLVLKAATRGEEGLGGYKITEEKRDLLFTQNEPGGMIPSLERGSLNWMKRAAHKKIFSAFFGW